MPASPELFRSLQEAGLTVVLDAPLVKRTWWRAGGPADLLVDCRTVDEVVALRQLAGDTPVFVLGNASNLLVSDLGIRGIVARLSGNLASAEEVGGTLVAGAGTNMMLLTSRMMKRGWTGLEFMAGIPGTIGGGVRMNAGTTLGEVVDALIDVDVVLRDGTLRTLPADELRMTYRTAHLPADSIIVSARFALTGADPVASRASIEHHLERRAATQPTDQPSCGSTFRNPPGDAAGRLIEAAGLKGFRIGQAEVSEKHANFIVNLGGATATEIRAVLEHVQAVVHERFEVALHQEVHFAGEWR